MKDKELWIQAFAEAEDTVREAGDTLSFTAGYEQIKSKLIKGVLSPEEAERDLTQYHAEYRETFSKG